MGDVFFPLLAVYFFFMPTETTFQAAVNYRFLYNFLLVLTEDQIFKLRNIAIGTNNLSVFTDREIRELELKLDEKTIHQ